MYVNEIFTMFLMLFCIYFYLLYIFYCLNMAGLAQLLECLTAEREVAGSIPRTGPTLRVLK